MCAIQLAVRILAAREQERSAILNNLRWEIGHVYLAAEHPNDWAPDQLNGSTIPSGTSFTLNNVSCDASSIRVITEDQNGRFLYEIVTCGDNATWTITNSPLHMSSSAVDISPLPIGSRHRAEGLRVSPVGSLTHTSTAWRPPSEVGYELRTLGSTALPHSALRLGLPEGWSLLVGFCGSAALQCAQRAADL